jgi:hypothetical protein
MKRPSIKNKIMTYQSLSVLTIASVVIGLVGVQPVRAATTIQFPGLNDAVSLYGQGQYLRAARVAFQYAQDHKVKEADANGLIALSLNRMGLSQSASYFFIRVLKSKDKASIRRVLPITQDLLVRVGAEVLTPYLNQSTQLDDYDPINRGAYLYMMAKQALVQGQDQKAIELINQMNTSSWFYPYALQLRGTALAIRDRNDEAMMDFKQCEDESDRITSVGDAVISDEQKAVLTQEAEDLKARCIAGQARVHYQANQFSDAELKYDRIPKKSLVWPDVLFEQAWNAFAKQEYNRALGKLVTYKSPALDFVFNSEVDVLKAQTYLMLCIYNDASLLVDQFNARYTPLAQLSKQTVEQHAGQTEYFWGQGVRVSKNSTHQVSDFDRMVGRFVRLPYFKGLIANEAWLDQERETIKKWSVAVGDSYQVGLPAFLEQVLAWRKKSIHDQGGNFVQNSLIDYHTSLVSDFEKMSFIKLEMLTQAKEKLIYKNRTDSQSRERGNVEPIRRHDQYYWSFNGEFWSDELGDYVFGLESECDPKRMNETETRYPSPRVREGQ